MGTTVASRRIDQTKRILGRNPELAAVITFVAVTAFFFALAPDTMSRPSIWGDIFRQTALIGIVAILVSMLMIAGDFDMPVGANYAFSAMIFIWVMNAGFNPLLAAAAALAFGLTVGLVNGVLVTYTGIHSFIITLGGLFALRGMVLLASGGTYVTLDAEPALLAVFNLELGSQFSIAVVWLFVVLGVIGYITHRHPFGNHLYAVGNDRDTARGRGIRVTRTRIIAFMMTAAAASFAGILVASRFGSVQASLGESMELVAIASAVLGGCALFGGEGSPLAGFLGALTFGVFQVGLTAIGAETFWYQTFVGLILIVAVILNRQIRGFPIQAD
jgi:simple sugar transport system permease protein